MIGTRKLKTHADELLRTSLKVYDMM